MAESTGQLAESTLRCHVYTSCCYVAAISIAAHILQYSLQQSFTEVSGSLVITTGVGG